MSFEHVFDVLDMFRHVLRHFGLFKQGLQVFASFVNFVSFGEF